MTRMAATSTPTATAAESAHVLDTSAAGPAVIRGGALRVAAYVVGTALGVAASALLYRHLRVVDTGKYSLAVSLVAIVAGLSDLGLTAIGVRELSVRTGEARDAIARDLVGLRVAVGVVGAVAVTIFSAAVGYGATLTVGVALAGVGLVLQSTQSTLSMALISDLRLGWVSGFEFLRAFLNALLIAVLVLAGAQLVAFLAVPIPVGMVVLALNCWILRGRIPLVPAFRASAWWSLMRKVLPYSAAVAASALYFYVAVVLVSLLASPHELGYFSVSARVIQVLIVLPGLAVGAAFPIFSRAARDDRDRLGYALGRVFEVSLILGAWVSLTLAIGASLAIKVIGGAEFAPATSVLAIQGVGLGASFVGAVWANGLLSLGHFRAILSISVFALVVGGALVALLVTVDGANGAAIATAAAEGVLALLNGVVLARLDHRLVPPLRVVPVVALALALAAATTLLPLPVIPSVLLASVIYGAVVVALRAVPRELREHLRWRRPAVS